MLESFIDINLGFWSGSFLTAFILLVIAPHFIRKKNEKEAIKKQAEAMYKKMEKEGKI